MHGGDLSMKSAGVGYGSTFTFKLQLYQASDLVNTPRVSLDTNNTEIDQHFSSFRQERGFTPCSDSNEKVSVPVTSRGISSVLASVEKLRFLVVDDSLMNRKMLVKLLVADKHTCDQMEDGEVAVKVVAAKRMVEAGDYCAE